MNKLNDIGIQLMGQQPDAGQKERYNCVVPSCNRKIVFGPRDTEFYKKMKWVNEKGEVIKPKKCKYHREEAKRKRENYTNQNEIPVTYR